MSNKVIVLKQHHLVVYNILQESLFSNKLETILLVLK